MGSCVSTHSKSSQGSAMNGPMSFTPKTTPVVAIPVSPIKDNSDTFDHNPVKSQSLWSADLGSKDDTFFDSQPWLESDGEEDFISVNGDSTPSSGNTPADQNLSKGTINPINSTAASTHEPSVKENSKKLVDLLKERVKEDQEESLSNKQLAVAEVDRDQNQPSKFAGTSTPSASGTDRLFCSSERTANGDISMNKAKSTQGCFTGLVSSCRSFSERKRRLSPAIVVTAKTSTLVP